MSKNYQVWLQANNRQATINSSSQMVVDGSGNQLYRFRNGRLSALSGNEILNIKADGRILDNTGNQVGFVTDYPEFMVEVMQTGYTPPADRPGQREASSSGGNASQSTGNKTNQVPDMASSWISSSTGKPFFKDEPVAPKYYKTDPPVRNTTTASTVHETKQETQAPPAGNATKPQKKSLGWVFLLIAALIIYFIISNNNNSKQKVEDTVLTSRDAAALQLREALINRDSSLVVKYRSKEKSNFNYAITQECQAMFQKAAEHTGNPNGGDRLAMTGSYGAVTYVAEEDKQGYIITITFSPTYFTTKEQETWLQEKITSTVRSLNLSGKSDYEKARAIYNWICNHVTYDYYHLNDESYKLQYTAYAAMKSGTCVCAGYAELFYRMALTAGLECRITLNSSMTHAWNLVRINGMYYYCDSTWDSGKPESQYQYFLKGQDDFELHTDLNFSMNYFSSSNSYLVNNIVQPLSRRAYK